MSPRRGPPGRGRRLRGDDDPIALTDALGVVADRIGAGPAPVVARIFSGWEELVGPAMASHVRPVRVDGPTLVVAVDHPAWVTQVRALAPDILAKVQAATGPDAPISRLETRVRPSG